MIGIASNRDELSDQRRRMKSASRALELLPLLRTGSRRLLARSRECENRRLVILLQRCLAPLNATQDPASLPFACLQPDDLVADLIEENAEALALTGDCSDQRKARAVWLDRLRHRLRENIGGSRDGGWRRSARGGEDRALAGGG